MWKTRRIRVKWILEFLEKWDKEESGDEEIVGLIRRAMNNGKEENKSKNYQCQS